MLDIYAGIAIMILVSALFFAFTFIVSSKFPRRVADFFAILAMIGMCLYIYYLWDKAEVTWFVPYSNAVIVGNWFPVITAVLSALVYHRVPKESSRKYWLVGLLNLVGFFSLIQPVLGRVPECKNETDDFGIARQSSQVSCSPTCAVNLLKYYLESKDSQPIATESEMAKLCLTREQSSWLGMQVQEGGTSWMGLYRGLKIKLQDTELEPHFFCLTFEKFIQDPTEDPLILSLKLDGHLEETQPDLYKDLTADGWRPGVEHNIIFRGFTKDNRVRIIDPKIGYEEMNLDWFKHLWVGRGIYISAH